MFSTSSCSLSRTKAAAYSFFFASSLAIRWSSSILACSASFNRFSSASRASLAKRSFSSLSSSAFLSAAASSAALRSFSSLIASRRAFSFSYSALSLAASRSSSSLIKRRRSRSASDLNESIKAEISTSVTSPELSVSTSVKLFLTKSRPSVRLEPCLITMP